MRINDRRQIPMEPPTHGFTLIELLVVVAIITILLALLLPALRAARESSNHITCRSNLAQLAAAWQMYLNENKGTFYQGVGANLDYGGWKGIVNRFPRVLNPYVTLPGKVNGETDAPVFRCPKDNGGVPGISRHTCYRYNGTSYQTNILLIGPDQLGQGPDNLTDLYKAINKRLRNLNIARVADHSKLLLVGDYGWVNQWDPESDCRTEWHNKDYHHNVAFLDGHAEFLKIRKGMFITEKYRVLPFEDLDVLAGQVQTEE